jgi:hypothetical protein
MTPDSTLSNSALRYRMQDLFRREPSTPEQTVESCDSFDGGQLRR